MPALKTSSAQLVAYTYARIAEICASDTIAFLDDPKVAFGGLRDVRERHTE